MSALCHFVKILNQVVIILMILMQKKIYENDSNIDIDL